VLLLDGEPLGGVRFLASFFRGGHAAKSKGRPVPATCLHLLHGFDQQLSHVPVIASLGGHL
jgi:hypothetical protein